MSRENRGFQHKAQKNVKAMYEYIDCVRMCKEYIDYTASNHIFIVSD